MTPPTRDFRVNNVAIRIAPNIRNTADGRIERIVSSNNRVKSNVRAHSGTAGPKASSTAGGQLNADELLSALEAMFAIDLVTCNSSAKHISCRI